MTEKSDREIVDIPAPLSVRELKWWEKIVYPAQETIQNIGLHFLALIKALLSGKINK